MREERVWVNLTVSQGTLSGVCFHLTLQALHAIGLGDTHGQRQRAQQIKTRRRLSQHTDSQGYVRHDEQRSTTVTPQPSGGSQLRAPVHTERGHKVVYLLLLLDQQCCSGFISHAG